MGFFGRLFKNRNFELLTRLEELQLARLEIEQVSAQKRHELEMRKLELEAEHAEELAKARTIEADAKLERRRKAVEWGREGKARQRERAAAAAPKPCKVCQGEISLIPADVAWHHAGHPDNFTMPMDWN